MTFIPEHRLFRILRAFQYVLLVTVHSISASAQEQSNYQRFQFRKFHWRVYHTSQYSVYFPERAGDSLYRFVLKEIPGAISHAKKVTIKSVPKHMNVIVYPAMTQLYESNIGSYEPNSLAFPEFVAKGKRLVLAYNGDYTDLKGQLYEAMVRAIVEGEIKGDDDLKISLDGGAPEGNKDVPFWFSEGSIRYLAHGWTIDAEDQLRNTFNERKCTSWQSVISYQPRLSGQAFCYFLSQRYFPTAVAQTIQQVQRKKKLPKAIRLVVKRNLDTLFQKCYEYYSTRYSRSQSANGQHSTVIVRRKEGSISSARVSPNGNSLLYSVLRNGRKRVFIQDLNGGVARRLYTYNLPPWINDHSKDVYPLINWSSTGDEAFVVVPRKKRIEIRKYGSDGKRIEKYKLNNIDGISSLEHIDGVEFLLSEFRNGHSDVARYNDWKERYYPYMDDEYDDAQATRLSDDELLVISNRPRKNEVSKVYEIGVGYKRDTLYQGLFRVKGDEIDPLVIDSVEHVKWGKPTVMDDGRVLMTTTKNGVHQSAIYDINDKSIRYIKGKLPTQYLVGSKEVVFVNTSQDSLSIEKVPFDDWLANSEANDTTSIWLSEFRAMNEKNRLEDSLLASAKDTTQTIFHQIFSGYGKDKKKKNKRKNLPPKGDGTQNYNLQLFRAFFNASVNNDYFINRYQPFLSFQGQFKVPEVGGLTKGGMTDLFENHHFTIAYGLPAATNGSTFFTRYENTEKQIDWGASYFRKVETLKPDPKKDWVDENGNKYPTNAKVKTHYYALFAKRPLSYYSYLSFQTGVRYDRTVFLATNKYTLDFPPLLSTWSINTLTYKVSKLKQTLPLLSRGLEFSANTDFCISFTQDKAALVGFTGSLTYHKPVYKYITAVAQLHCGVSVGDRYMLYNLGGKDNNLTPKIDTSVQFDQSAPYAFQTLITPFRGYSQNSLYGDRYVLGNLDVYFPVFKTLIPLETSLPSINNLQLLLLTDIGNAWETWRPSKQHRWKWSYGIGIRTVLATYPLRLDVAWPGTFGRKPLWYFTLSI